MRQFTQANYKEVRSSEQTAMVFFTSSGCHLCVKLKPILKKLEKHYAGSINFYLCDIDKEKKLSNRILNDEGVPTGFIMKDNLIFKVKDPELPDNDSWYSEEYLQKLIKTLQ
jgi:thiol-disulfide isomerase/thioredoxin